MKPLFMFFLSMVLPVWAICANTDSPKIAVDDISAAHQLGSSTKSKGYKTPLNNPAYRPMYGYFYTKSPETVLDDQPVRLDRAAMEISGIRLNSLDHHTVFIDHPGRYYVSWKISATKDADIDKGLRFALVSPETEFELPSSLFSIDEDPATSLLHVKGESIIDVPPSGLLLQIRNVSGYAVKLQSSQANLTGHRATHDRSPNYAATLLIYAPPSFSNYESNTTKNTITPSDLEAIFEVKGQPTDSQIRFAIARKARTGEFDLRLDSGMNINSVAAFAGSDEKASVNGDLVVYEDESSAVLNSLERGNIKVVSSFVHGSNSKNKTVFLHYKGQGNAKKLAQTIKQALSYANEYRIYCHAANLASLIDGTKCKSYFSPLNNLSKP